MHFERYAWKLLLLKGLYKSISILKNFAKKICLSDFSYFFRKQSNMAAPFPALCHYNSVTITSTGNIFNELDFCLFIGFILNFQMKLLSFPKPKLFLERRKNACHYFVDPLNASRFLNVESLPLCVTSESSNKNILIHLN